MPSHMIPISAQVSVIEKVTDLIFVDILNRRFEYESFEYIIYDGHKKIVRKGYFRAPSVQLRTNNLQEGTYSFQLLLNGEVWNTTEFRKKHDQYAFA